MNDIAKINLEGMSEFENKAKGIEEKINKSLKVVITVDDLENWNYLIK